MGGAGAGLGGWAGERGAAFQSAVHSGLLAHLERGNAAYEAALGVGDDEEASAMHSMVPRALTRVRYFVIFTIILYFTFFFISYLTYFFISL